MKATARKKAEKTGVQKWGEKKSGRWLLEQVKMSVDGSFVVTTRNLAALWGCSTGSVNNLLKSMELSGQIAREVLPNNGGTRITFARKDSKAVIVPLVSKRRFVKNDSGRENWSFSDIETLQSPPSKALMDRLAAAYHAIIYGEAGFEGCDVEHLELIEQALFGRAANDNEADETKVAA